jgi:hypothetical protein
VRRWLRCRRGYHRPRQQPLHTELHHVSQSGRRSGIS